MPGYRLLNPARKVCKVLGRCVSNQQREHSPTYKIGRPSRLIDILWEELEHSQYTPGIRFIDVRSIDYCARRQRRYSDYAQP